MALRMRKLSRSKVRRKKMAEGMNSYSLADIAAMMRNNEGDGFLNGNGRQ